MTDSVPIAARDEEPPSGPEQRLEHLRFFVEEAPDAPSKSMLDWMQEAERQIANLRGRLNDLPPSVVRGPIIW